MIAVVMMTTGVVQVWFDIQPAVSLPKVFVTPMADTSRADSVGDTPVAIAADGRWV